MNIWKMLFGANYPECGVGCPCANCYGIAAQERAAEVYYNNDRKPTPYVPEKEVKGERVDNQVKGLEGK